jgi:small subunit ribosomal protein S21
MLQGRLGTRRARPQRSDLVSRVLFFALQQGMLVVEVIIGENDRIDLALKQFQRKVIRAGVLKDVRKKRYYEKPSQARQRKSSAARQRQARAQRAAR